MWTQNARKFLHGLGLIGEPSGRLNRDRPEARPPKTIPPDVKFRAKSREFEDVYKELVEQATPRVIRNDYEALTKKGIANGRDIYLFLRSLSIAGAIRFPDENMIGLKSFEEVLSAAIDSDHRIVGCVGNGGERLGTAQIHFDTDWKSKIVPLFKSAVVIISMPSPTPGCLEESNLIRNRKELLAKTLFVLPPLWCYRPSPGPKLWPLEEDFVNFQREMVHVHRKFFGLNFPEPTTENDGFFVMMDFETGNVATSRPWKIVKMTLDYKSGRPSTTDKFPSLDERDIRAAVEMVLRARGLRQSETSPS